MTGSVTIKGQAVIAADSFAELRRWHARETEALRATVRPDVAALRGFVALVQASGANIAAEDERLGAQDILDYWAAELISAVPSEMASWSPPRLAPPTDRGHAGEVVERTPQPASSSAKEHIRLAASARLWRDSGYKSGYLLFGQALADAKRIAGDDPDIAALVKASDKAERGRTLVKRLGLSFALLALVTTTVVFAWLWYQANRDREIARQQTKDAITQRSLAEESARSANLARGKAQLDFDIAQTRLNELNTASQQLDAALALIHGELAKGELRGAQIPSSLQSRLVVAAAAPTEAITTIDGAGYAADFLEAVVPLPKRPTGTPAAAAPLNYPNYSIVLDPSRRLALVAASNIDRQKLRILPQTAAGSGCDPRIPADQQPDPAGFGSDFEKAQLVTRQEVAWGPTLDDAAATRRFARFLDLCPNFAPQFGVFNRGVWAGLDRWIMSNHNRGAVRVSVLSGPVLRDDDPVLAGVKVPRAFWKVAVSQRSNPGDGLVVDAFMIPQFIEDSMRPAADAVFQPDQYRTALADIEQAAQLDFGVELRQAEQGIGRGADLANAWADRAGQLDGPTLPGRQSAVQGMIDSIRDPALPDVQKRDLVTAVAALGVGDNARTLSLVGRVNMLVVLSKVLKRSWDRPDWIDAKAAVRRSIADLQTRADPAQPLGPNAASLIATLKPLVGWDDPKGKTVYVQFANMTRPAAQAVTADLKALGWAIPPEEQVPEAKARNGVYYTSPDDRDEATLLAADLRAQGQHQVNRVERIKGGRPGTLEVWISP